MAIRYDIDSFNIGPTEIGPCDTGAGDIGSCDVRFSDDVRARVNNRTRMVMSAWEDALPHLWSVADRTHGHFVMLTAGDVRVQHNHFVKAILASSAAKLVSQTLALMEAVNRYDFLTYAVSAKALVEITATLRHLVMDKLRPIVEEMVAAGTYNPAQVRRLVDEEALYLHGTRFDWIEYFERGFRPLNERYPEWAEGSETPARKWRAGYKPPMQQVDVGVCMEAWAAAQPGVGILYDLLCDMTHPNIGSLMGVTVPAREGMRFRIHDPDSEGMMLFQYSFPAFWSLTGHEYKGLLYGLLQLVLPTAQVKEKKAP